MQHVIVIGGGLLTVPLIERVRAMGLCPIVFDADREAPGMQRTAHPCEVSTRDPEGGASAAARLACQFEIVGVTTAGADVERSVAAVASRLGLPGPSPAAALRCNHKATTRRVLAEAGVPGPAFAELCAGEDAATAANKVGYPLMVKPLDECGSRGVIRVDGEPALEQAVETAAALSRAGVLLEAFVEGSTHTVEMMGRDGDFELLSIIDTHHGYAPYAVELMHHNPSRRSDDDQRAMVTVAKRALHAVGLSAGPAKVDFLFSETLGPQVMEMTARLSGGFHCQYTTPLARGSDNLRAAVDACRGIRPRDIDLFGSRAHHASCVAHFPTPGEVVAIEGLEATRALPGVAAVFVLAATGDPIPEPRSSADRRVFVIASGETPAACDAAQARARDTLRVVTAPGGGIDGVRGAA